MRIAISSVGIGSRIDATAGSALIGEELGTIDAVILWPYGSAVRALASAGVGAYHIRVQGVASGNNLPRSGSNWSVALTPGLGLQADIGPRVALTAEAQVLVALPPPSVRIGPDEFGPAGDPSFVISAGITGNF
jgi:hypothetical protein